MQSAVERQIEIIGEAARRVPRHFRDAHVEVQWQGIIGQRNVLAHEYGDIIQRRFWRVARVHIPALIAHLSPLVPAAPEQPEGDADRTPVC